MIELNETPVRTSKNYNINNIRLEKVELPLNVTKFENINILGDNSKVNIDEKTSNIDLVYGLNKDLTNQVVNNANKRIRLDISSKTNKETNIEYVFDNKNNILVDDIEIISEEAANATIYIKYMSDEEIDAFHNGVIRVNAKENSKINIVIVNMLSSKANNLMAIQNTLEDNAKVNYTIVDFGGNNSITNYYSNLVGENSDNQISTIYIGKDNQVFDLNYIAELRGIKSNVDIDVQGALKDTAKKHFKGTIDFKKGCKKASGDENESCMLLSDSAKSIALPMLLCSEEDVQGNHSSSAGKVGEKELFYIMSRGFDQKNAMKLMVRAKFNKILEKIKNEDIKNQIISKMDKILD